MKIFSMFDGVGGFIVGLENSSKEVFQTLYSNQYEPSRKTQDAYEVGLYRFPDIEHIPTDVALIPNEKFAEMKYFYSFCFNGCLGFIRTWLENGENMPPEYAARLTFQMVVSSLDAFYEDAKENK